MTDRTITGMMLTASLIGLAFMGWVLFLWDVTKGVIG